MTFNLGLFTFLIVIGLSAFFWVYRRGKAAVLLDGAQDELKKIKRIQKSSGAIDAETKNKLDQLAGKPRVGESADGKPAVGSADDVTDLWRVDCGGSATCILNRRAFTVGQTDVPDEPEYYFEMDRSVVGVSTTALGQRIEDVRTLAGKNVTYTFWARSDAASFDVEIDVLQGFGAGGSADADTADTTITLTTTWTKHTVNISVPSLTGKTVTGDSFVAFRLMWPIGEGATDEIWFAHAQVVEGSVGQTVYEQKTFAEYLLETKRYKDSSFPYGTAWGQNAGRAGSVQRRISFNGAVNQGLYIKFMVPAYENGGIVFYNTDVGNANWYNIDDAANSGAANALDDGTHGFFLNHTQIGSPTVDGPGERVSLHWSKEVNIGP